MKVDIVDISRSDLRLDLDLHSDFVLTVTIKRKLTTVKCIFFLKILWEINENSKEAIQLFVERSPQIPAPSRQGNCILHLIQT